MKIGYDIMKKKTPIYDFLKEHAAKNPTSFHMPGHKGAALYKRFGYEGFFADFMDYDITEIPGADNLFQTEGILKEAQDRYAVLYGVRKSYLLINGTSGGIIAAILASVQKGKKLIMARNCHKSVFNALTLGDIQPIYAYPEMMEEHGISGVISVKEVERLLKENPDAGAVILPSPNYYGICSPIEDIARVVHEHNKILIVDEAHGAHLKFFEHMEARKEGDLINQDQVLTLKDSKEECPYEKNTKTRNPKLEFPKSAVTLGADLVINSIHKTLASLTQSAILHLNSDRVDQSVLEDKLQCIESTSPSYILMASLDVAAFLLEEHGEQLMGEWTENLVDFYNRARSIQGLHIMDDIVGMDLTKINMNMSDIGISGGELDRILAEEYHIFMELVTGDLVMGMTGIGNTKKDFNKLADALKVIAQKYGNQPETKQVEHQNESEIQNKEGLQNDGYKITRERTPLKKLELPKQPELFSIPKTKRRVALEDAEGLICASSIIPYPPGIPLICPGEKLEKDAIEYIKELRAVGEKVIGVNELGEITVG